MSRRNRKPRRKATKTPPPWKIAGYKSEFEYNAAANFTERGVEFQYEPCVLEYEVNETKKYTPDFILPGLPFYLEFKGWFTLEDRKKALRVRASHPDKEVRFVFQKPFNKIKKGSKTSYADWCDKNGFMWADTFVPQQWLDEQKEST